MEFKTKHIDTEAALAVPYIEQGDPTGPPVIFLHGVTDSHRSFELLFPHLPKTLRAIAMTQRGHGEAAKSINEFGPREMAGDVATFMRAKEIRSAVIVGHSMGSFAAQRFAIDHPERVGGLVLIGSFPTCADNDGVKNFVDAVVAPLEDPIPRDVAAEFQASTFSKPLPDWFYEMVVNESLKVPARIWKAACRAMIDADNGPDLPRIQAKTLLMWGAEDGFFPIGVQRKLLDSIPDSSLSVYEGAGHSPHWEEPERLANEIAGFVNELIARERIAYVPVTAKAK